MLVLSRKENQKVFIGSEVVLTLLAIRGDKVRIGIEAPQGIQIARDDLSGQSFDNMQQVREFRNANPK